MQPIDRNAASRFKLKLAKLVGAGRGLTPRCKAIIFSFILIAANSGLVAPTASADSSVCSAAKDVTFTCNNVKGHGMYLDHVETSFNTTVKGATICGYSSYVRVSVFGNRTFHEFRESSGGNCGFQFAWLNIPINSWYFTNKAYVCVTNYIDNVQQGRDMCIKLTPDGTEADAWQMGADGNMFVDPNSGIPS